MSAELIKLVLDDADEKMGKAVEHARKEFSGVRTGRAAPALVEKIPVDYYGSEVPAPADRWVPGARGPHARHQPLRQERRSAPSRRRSSTPTSASTRATTAQVIRLTFPQLTAERRKELVRVVKRMAEDGRVAVRNVRRGARHDLDGLAKDGDATEDDITRAEKELDKLTHAHEAEIDKALEHKEAELLEV